MGPGVAMGLPVGFPPGAPPPHLCHTPFEGALPVVYNRGPAAMERRNSCLWRARRVCGAHPVTSW